MKLFQVLKILCFSDSLFRLNISRGFVPREVTELIKSGPTRFELLRKQSSIFASFLSQMRPYKRLENVMIAVTMTSHTLPSANYFIPEAALCRGTALRYVIRKYTADEPVDKVLIGLVITVEDAENRYINVRQAKNSSTVAELFFWLIIFRHHFINFFFTICFQFFIVF